MRFCFLRFGGSIYLGRDAYTIITTLLFSVPSAAGSIGIALLPPHPVLHLCYVHSTSRCYSSEGSSIAFGVTRCFVGLILLRHTLKNRMAELRDSCTRWVLCWRINIQEEQRRVSLPSPALAIEGKSRYNAARHHTGICLS